MFKSPSVTLRNLSLVQVKVPCSSSTYVCLTSSSTILPALFMQRVLRALWRWHLPLWFCTVSSVENFSLPSWQLGFQDLTNIPPLNLVQTSVPLSWLIQWYIVHSAVSVGQLLVNDWFISTGLLGFSRKGTFATLARTVVWHRCSKTLYWINLWGMLSILKVALR